jgi:ABC-type sugar transport system ATPase subunit
VTSLFVTHDQEEALALGDRVLLMRDGRIEQAGSPSELYGDPRTIFAATFFGIPRCNVVAAANGDNALNSFGKYAALARPELLPAHRAPSSVSLAFRPEAVIIVEPSRSGAIPLKVDWVEAIGPDSIVCLNGDHFVTARVRGSPNLAGGSIVGIHIQQERLMAFDTVSGGRIG